MAWQQAITWANVDLDPCCHMASLGHNELTQQSPYVACFIVWDQNVVTIVAADVLTPT